MGPGYYENKYLYLLLFIYLFIYFVIRLFMKFNSSVRYIINSRIIFIFIPALFNDPFSASSRSSSEKWIIFVFHVE